MVMRVVVADPESADLSSETFTVSAPGICRRTSRASSALPNSTRERRRAGDGRVGDLALTQE